MSLWASTTEKPRVLIEIINREASPVIKRYSNMPCPQVNGVTYEGKLRLQGAMTNRTPFLAEENYPIPALTFEVICESADRTFFLKKELYYSEVILYLIEHDAVVITSADKQFTGFIPFRNGIKWIKENIVTIRAQGLTEALVKRYPLSVTACDQKAKVNGIIVSNLPVETTIPIVYGNFDNENSNVWDKVRTEDYTGDIDVIKAINYSEISTYSAEKQYSYPSIFGGLPRQLVGLTDLAAINYDGIDAGTRLRGASDYKKFHESIGWDINVFESLDVRNEGEEQKTSDGETLEVGALHKIAWRFFEDLEADISIVAIGYKDGWDYIESTLTDVFEGFYIVFINNDINKVCVTYMDANGSIGYRSNKYIVGGSNWYEPLRDFGGTVINTASITDFKCWHKTAPVSFGSGEHNFFCFIYTDALGNGHICFANLTYWDTGVLAFQFQVKIEWTAALNAYDVSDALISWFDAGVSREGARVFLDRAVNGNKLFCWHYSNIKTTANPAFTSIIGCESFCKSSLVIDYKDQAPNMTNWTFFLNCENSLERLYLYARYSSNNIYVVEWRLGGGSPVALYTINTSSIGVSLELVGFVMFNEITLPTFKNSFIFANDRTNNTTYLITHCWTGIVYVSRIIELDFDVIYDVCTVTRGKSESYVFLATSEGVFFMDLMNTLYIKEPVTLSTTNESAWNDASINGAFELYSDVVVNCLNAMKKSQIPWDYNDIGTTLPTWKKIIIDLYLSGGAFSDNGKAVKWKSPDSSDGYIRFSSKYDSLSEIGFFGSMGIDSSEQIYWERLAMWLIHRAEGNTAFNLTALNKPDIVDWSSWEAAKALRDNYFTGSFRVYIKERDLVINLVWRLLKQIGQIPYMDYFSGSEPKLKLHFAFQKITSTIALTKLNSEFVNVQEYPGYTTEIILHFNKIMGDFYSWNIQELADRHGGDNRNSFRLSSLVHALQGIKTSITGTAWQTLIKFLLAHESNYDAHDGSEGKPIRIATFLVKPPLYQTPLFTGITVSSEYPQASGIYKLIGTGIDFETNFLQWIMLEQATLNYDGLGYP